jgi:hypothetical protein
VKSDFAILDVKAGRKALLKRLEAGERIEVVIRGTISTAWGPDDGTSQEFTVDVTELSEGAA